MALTGLAPTVTRTSGIVINPLTGALVVSGQTAGLSQSTNRTITPGAAALVLSSVAPNATDSGARPPGSRAHPMSGGTKRSNVQHIRRR
jgi:hypothetical protein